MKDEVNPTGKWKFDGEVTNVFENMLERSIPQYEEMRELTKKIGSNHIRSISPRPRILDLGCSNGLSLKGFVEILGANANYTGFDISDPMLEAAKERFEEEIQTGYVSILKYDLRNLNHQLLGNANSYSGILSILTIQFTPIEYRQDIIQTVYDLLMHNGVFLFVEKVLGNDAVIDAMMVNEYLKRKEEYGYTRDQIDSKKTSLEGVMVPLSSDWNKDLLKRAGFKRIDTYWKWLNFEGYVAIK